MVKEVDDMFVEDCDDHESQSGDDSLYDDELEDDMGDEEDISAEIRRREEDRRFDEQELMADVAALRGIEITEPTSLSTLLQEANVPKSSESLRGRSATKGLKVKEPMVLEFDDLGRPKGKWRRKYGQNAGFCMRKFNINWSWKDVSEGTKKLLWEDTMNLFHINDNERKKKNFMSLVAKRFRDFKSKLVSGWITKTRKISKDGREPPAIWKHIKVEDWKLFQQLKTISPAKRKRERAIECAKKNEHHHHLGQYDFDTARAIWIEDKFYPGSTSAGTDSTASVSIDINRADDWYCAMHSKDKETGKYVIKNPRTEEVAGKLIEFRKKEADGVMVPYRNKDALYFALGEKEDHPSRARGFGGVNVSVRNAFGVSDKAKVSVKSSEDRDALKNELKEELKNEMGLEIQREMKEELKIEMRLEFQSTLSSILQEMGLPTAKLHDVVEKCTDNDTKHQKLSIAKVIKDDTPCRLFMKDPQNGLLYEVARGKTFQGDVCHQSVVALDHIRVKIYVVPKEFENLPLPVPLPTYDLNLLIDAVGSFVQWPIEFVRVESESCLDGKEKELMGSNSHLSKLSTTPIKNHSQELVVQSLSPDCQWLQTLVSAMGIGETFSIHFDADSPPFYYTEEQKNEVNQDDLNQFLQGSELTIPVVQIFMRALQEDLVKDKSGVHIGWLCPAITADGRLMKKMDDAISYISNAFLKSNATLNGDKFILAPISDSKHWVLLAICPQTFTIYLFDPMTLKDGRNLRVKMVIDWALKKFKMSGGHMKMKRYEPLWKSMKCPQQSGSVDDGLFVMRFMYDIVNRCSTASDFEKIWILQNEQPYTYGDE